MSIKINIVDIKGSASGEYTLEDQYIELERGDQAVHDVVVAYLAGERAGTACTKTRAEVRGGGAKPFKQKGLGRARSGSIRNPIWRGGGTIFGPKPRSFAKKVNKKVRQLALKRAFSERATENSVLILDEFKLVDHKTKNVQTILKDLNADLKPALIIVKDYEENALRAAGNIDSLLLMKASTVNVYQLLRFNKVIITKEAMDDLVHRFL